LHLGIVKFYNSQMHLQRKIIVYGIALLRVVKPYKRVSESRAEIQTV